MTALHVAVCHQRLSVVSILLSHGANVNSVSRYDCRTPLHVGASYGNTDVIRLLVDNRASVDQTDVYGSTALHLAVVNCHLDAAQELIDCRTDVNAYDNNGWTALHLAAEQGHLLMIKLLIGSKAHVECQTKFGRTPLHWACCRGHLQACIENNELRLLYVKSDNEWLGLDRQEDRYVQYEKKSIKTQYRAYLSQNKSHFTCRVNGIARIMYFAVLQFTISYSYM